MNKDIYITNFCSNVKMLRKANGLTTQEMAKILGIGTKSLSMIEQGALPKRLSVDITFEIYKNFGVNPKDLFTLQSDN